MRNQGPTVHGHAYMPPRHFIPTPKPGAAPPSRGGSRRMLFGVGMVCILAGVALVAGPLWGVWQRGAADQNALSAWQNGGANAIAGPNPNVEPGALQTLNCGSGSTADYALVKFNDPGAYNYAGVAGDGTWEMLHQRSMVHYASTPAPGQAGNVIIAFHREPNYEHIDDLKVGGMVTVEDRNCHTYTYKISGRWVLDPNAVTQLVPTTGHELTLITCTPFWQDTERLVWRAELVSA